MKGKSNYFMVFLICLKKSKTSYILGRREYFFTESKIQRLKRK
uniref:Uncharacterized protein n=1 Tax=Arundo donax TaxID=35708 RepID=A0A0A8ZZH0_ARUDO